MADLKRIFGGPFTPPREIPLLPPEKQLRRAIAAAGLTPPNEIIMDGRIHRFASGTKDKRGRDDAGWYVAFPGDVPTGVFGCWRSGIVQTWRADVGRRLSEEEIAAYRRKLEKLRQEREEALKRQYAAVAKKVARIWAKAPPATLKHPYLERKGVKPHGARLNPNGHLILPIFTPSGVLSSLQYIAADGTKRYHPRGRVSGCYWMLGHKDKPEVLYVAEGFATAATVYEATNQPTVVAYSAHNLVPVMGALRVRFGAAQDIVIVADNDASGTGQRYAEMAVAKWGGRYVMPPVEGDANDYALAGGDLIELLTNNK